MDMADYNFDDYRFRQILSGAIPLKDSLAGPLGMHARLVVKPIKGGVTSFFLQQVLVSIWRYSISSLSPVLDGGHLLFFMFEIVLANLSVCVHARWLSVLVYLS